MEVRVCPRAFWSSEARLALLFIISYVVSVRGKKKIYEVWMQNSQVWNSSHVWKTRLTEGNKCHCVGHPHTLGSDRREEFALYLSALLHLGLSRSHLPAAPRGPQAGDNWKCSPVFAVISG